MEDGLNQGSQEGEKCGYRLTMDSGPMIGSTKEGVEIIKVS